jgi:cysteine desulfurase
MKDVYGNPSSIHAKGIEAERIVADARISVANALDTYWKNVVFMSSGSEANNFAIFNACRTTGKNKGQRQIITTAAEHPSVLKPLHELKNHGFRVDYCEVKPDGVISFDVLEELISSETRLIAVSHVNSETGTVQDIGRICKIRDKRNPGVYILSDCVQSFCKLDTPVRKFGVDFASVSSHKIHGPKGAAALYISDRVKPVPRIFGGGQEIGLRSGTENVPAIAGFGLAAEKMCGALSQNYETMSRHKASFLTALDELSETGYDYQVISNDDNSSPYIVNIGFGGIKAEVLVRFLSELGIYASAGSACSSARKVKSGTMTVMGVADKYADGAVRFSFSALNSDGDAIAVVNALKSIIPKLLKAKKSIG